MVGHTKLHANEHLKGEIDEILEIDATQIANGDVTNTEFNRLDGVTDTIATEEFVYDKLEGLDWQESVISKTTDVGNITPSEGDRYIVPTDATGDWENEDDKLAVYRDGSWHFITPDQGFALWVEDEDQQYNYNDDWDAGEWVKFGSTMNHGALTGLGEDDHTQYLLVDGTRAMDGSLDMGNNSITDVNLVDGINVSDHDHTGNNDGVNIPNGGLVNDSVTVTAGTNLSGGGEVSLGNSITINNDIEDLDDLGDVSSVSYTDGDVLRADGTGYVTATLGHDDLDTITEDDHHDAFEQLLDDSDNAVSPDANNRIKIATDNTINATANANQITLSTTDEAGATTLAALTDTEDDAAVDDNLNYTSGYVLRADGTDAYVETELKHTDLESTSISRDDHTGPGNGLEWDNDNIGIETNGVGTNEIDESISPTWTGTHTFTDEIDISDGDFLPPMYSQDSEPSIPNNSFAIWNNTDDNDYWVLVDIGGAHFKVEIT